MSTTYRDPVAIITAGMTIPDGCDAWGVKTVHADFTTSNGYRWPFPGSVATAPGPILRDNGGASPAAVGDGICIGTDWDGMASAGIPALTVLVVAYHNDDALGRCAGKVRLKSCRVVELVDGARFVREKCRGADLRGAYLRGVYLRGADLRGAYLRWADLGGADLRGADLTGAIGYEVA